MGEKGYSGRLMYTAAHVHTILSTRRRIRVQELADILECSYRTASRWAQAYSGCMPLRIDRGVIIVEDDK